VIVDQWTVLAARPAHSVTPQTPPALVIAPRAEADRDTWCLVPDLRHQARPICEQAQPGPLTGIWLSSYEYESTGRGATFTSHHYVAVVQHGTRLQVRSTPGSRSRLLMDLTANGQVLTGTWTEETNPAGYYQGAVYHGAIQLLLEPTGRKMTGKWVGFGRDFDLNTGPWTLELITGTVTEETLNEYSRPADGD